MNMLPIALAAGVFVALGKGTDRMIRGRRRSATQTQLQADTNALDARIDDEEQLRHESELRSGQFDMQG